MRGGSAVKAQNQEFRHCREPGRAGQRHRRRTRSMFTIKHVDLDGSEFLVECERFVTERRSDGFLQYLAYGPVGTPPEAYIASWCGDDNVPRDRLGWHTLYVMNRFGATVATHRF